MYNIQECRRCRTRYKDAPGFIKRGTALRFYSESADEGHPGTAHIIVHNDAVPILIHLMTGTHDMNLLFKF